MAKDSATQGVEAPALVAATVVSQLDRPVQTLSAASLLSRQPHNHAEEVRHSGLASTSDSLAM